MLQHATRARGPLLLLGLMVVIAGLDRLPGSAIEGMDDALWRSHTSELRDRFEAQGANGSLSFAQFAAQFAEGLLQTEAMKVLDAARASPAMVGGRGGLGPAWTRGEIERPAGTRSMGTWTAAVYTEEQQARLGVDEQGRKRTRFPVHWGEPPRAQTKDLRPLPGGYGSGSGTLAAWIEEKMSADAAAAGAGPAVQDKTEWPELVGEAGAAAVDAIRLERPDLEQVETMPEDAMVTMDFREDRVRVFVDAAGKVARPPSCG